ncbi:MAG: UDP-N-acetylglucosamine 1-carboxyvinyltransferase [Bacillota bacterium]|nr:UDP-N-acetylglucosamine 1-carboxyvinyltransferase [Bacillota bacterium]
MEGYEVIGGTKIRGTVRISGAKNAVLPMLAATLLVDRPCEIIDAPDLRDVTVMTQILERLGAKVVVGRDQEGKRTLTVDAGDLWTHEVPDSLMRQMRSSIFLMGPLLGRMGKVRVSYPGGCAIGPRPIDLHLSSLQALGVRIEERGGYIDASTGGLRGTEIHLDFPSVGATENTMMAAVTARGITVIRNAAKEPEIVDLQNFLNAVGAKIRGAGLDVIRIEGTHSLGGARHQAIPDRIETGTFMAAACITGGEVLMDNCIQEHVEAAIAKLQEAGAEIEEAGDHQLHVAGPSRVRAVDFKTLPYPGFPTDMQPQVMSLMTLGLGTSVITETIFENRFNQAEELKRMGANVKTEGRTAVIKGVNRLFGATVAASDLRSGAALVLAGLAAEGRTVVEGCHHIDRGYEGLESKLSLLGARVRRIPVNGS